MSNGTEQQLPTGEKITVRECQWRLSRHQWEATAIVYDLPGAPDRHAAGSTQEEAVKNLKNYIKILKKSADAVAAEPVSAQCVLESDELPP